MPSQQGRIKRQAAVGIDGARGGWFSVRLSAATDRRGRHREDAAQLQLTRTLEPVLLTAPTATAIDMPMGFATRRDRDVERVLRQALPAGARQRVFGVPVRAVVDAWPLSHERASALNRVHAGVGLSIQTWHILARMHALDRLLRAHPERTGHVTECHPELCFARLGGDCPPVKRSQAGRRWRLDCLGEHVDDPERLLARARATWPARLLASDDVLDATVLAVTRGLPPTHTEQLPAPVRCDAHGIAMAVLAPRIDT